VTGPRGVEYTAKIKGKSATVTYDILTESPEDEALLEQVVSSALSSIVNQNREQLKQRLQIAAPALRKPRDPTKKYARENVDQPDLISLGGKWLYAVSVVSDEQGGKAVRIAKGQILGNWRKNKETHEMEYFPNDPMNPISLSNKINIKTLDEWNRLQPAVVSRLQVLQETK
jgi:hypothetical protein